MLLRRKTARSTRYGVVCQWEAARFPVTPMNQLDEPNRLVELAEAAHELALAS